MRGVRGQKLGASSAVPLVRTSIPGGSRAGAVQPVQRHGRIDADDPAAWAFRSQRRELLVRPSGADDEPEPLLYDLAMVKEKQGDAAKARECLARIYEGDISYRDVAEQLERLQQAGG